MFAMTRDIIKLTKQPDLRKRWINAIVQYIREHYGKRPDVDAIVGPDRRGHLFAFAVAFELHKPYLQIRKPENVSADADGEDLRQTKYINRYEKVNCFCEFIGCFFVSVNKEVMREKVAHTRLPSVFRS